MVITERSVSRSVLDLIRDKGLGGDVTGDTSDPSYLNKTKRNKPCVEIAKGNGSLTEQVIANAHSNQTNPLVN